MTNIVKIETSFNDINLPAQSIWFSGCNNGKGKCPGCHNERLKVERQGLSLKQIDDILSERRRLTEWVVYLGGEPLDYLETLKRISQIAYKYNYRQILFTGYDLNDGIMQHIELDKEILQHVDYIKMGRYIENQQTVEYHFASTNQRIYNIHESYPDKEVYFYDINKKIEETLK